MGNHQAIYPRSRPKILLSADRETRVYNYNSCPPATHPTCSVLHREECEASLWRTRDRCSISETIRQPRTVKARVTDEGKRRAKSLLFLPYYFCLVTSSPTDSACSIPAVLIGYTGRSVLDCACGATVRCKSVVHVMGLDLALSLPNPLLSLRPRDAC